MTIEIDLDKIERVAKDATPGRWEPIDRCGFRGPGIQRSDEGGFIVEGTSKEQEDADVAFIVATQPAVILELVRRLREAEKDAARYRWLRDVADAATWEMLGYQDIDKTDAAVDSAMGEPK